MHAETFVHAIYRDEKAAVQAAEALIDSKFPAGDIGALLRGQAPELGDDSELKEIEIKHTTGMPIGAAIGGALGAIGGALIATGAVIATGPIALAIEGAIAGGAFGTLSGVLGGLAYWKETIRFPEHAFEHGGVLLGVNAHGPRIAEARDVLTRTGGEDVSVSTKPEARTAAKNGSNLPQAT